jgi:hypothetical protein
MDPPPRREFTIEELLDDLDHGKTRVHQSDATIRYQLLNLRPAAKIPAKQRNLRISTTVDRISTRAYEDGLSNSSLDRLIDIITLPNELDQASVNNLIENLYPATKVSNSTVTKVIGSLGHGKSKPSYSSQTALLKWMVMIYNVLENTKFISQLYPVLFNLLDTSTIRYLIRVSCFFETETDKLQAAAMSHSVSDHSKETRPALQDPSLVNESEI